MELENNAGSGISGNDLEAQIMADALKEFNTQQPPTEETPQDQPATEVTEQQTEATETTETPQPETVPEVKTPEPAGTVTPEVKSFYTPEEIEKEISEHGDLVKLDSSRLSPEGKLIQASMQRGFTPRLQEAAELRKRFDQLVAEKTALESQRLKEENERKYQEEAEQFGEEQAKLMKEVREYRGEVAKIKQEREYERQQWAADQQKVAAEKFRSTFAEKASTYGIPQTQEWEDIVMSRVWAENQTRQLNGQDFITIDDGLKLVSGTVGISNADNIEKLLNANPKAMEALENKWKEKFAQQKSVGPTVVKSAASGSSNKIEPKASADKFDPKTMNDANYDVREDIAQEAIKELKKLGIIK
jgi:hypothetical protein